jgi:hypothetical protein
MWPQVGKRAERRKSGGRRTSRGVQGKVLGNAASEQFVIGTLCGVPEQSAGNFEIECSHVPKVTV